MMSFFYSSESFPEKREKYQSMSFVNILAVAALLFLFAPVLYGQKEGMDRVVYKNGVEIKGVITGIDSANVYCVIQTENYDVKRIIPKGDIKSVFYCDGTVYAITPDSCTTAIKMTDKTNRELAIESFCKNMRESEHMISAGVNATFFNGDIGPMTYNQWMWDAGSLNRRIRMSYNVGFGFNSIIDRRFSIQYGLEYSSKGFSLSRSTTYHGNSSYSTSSDSYEKVIYMVDYLQVPVSVTFSPINWQSSLKTYGYLRSGISTSVLVRSKYKHTALTKGFLGIYFTEEKDDAMKLKHIRPIDFNMFLALGIRRWEHFGFEAKYEIGLIDLANYPEADTKMLNRAVSVNVICYF